MFLSLYRAFTFGLQNFLRNIWLSIVTIFILVLTLFSITFSTGLSLVAQRAIVLIKERVDVSVYFTEKALEEDVQGVQKELMALPQVRDVAYISPEEALNTFRQRHQGNPVILETLEVLGSNPLGPILVIRAKNIEDFAAILTVLDRPTYADLIQDRDFEENQQVIQRLTDITNRLRQIGLVVSIIFSVIAVLVIFNTIRITIYTYREEINIMKLVGATNAFVRAPFVLESILYAVLASVVTLLLLIPLVGISAPFLDQFFVGYNFDLVTYFRNHLWSLFGIQTAIGILLAIVSSMIALGRYLRV